MNNEKIYIQISAGRGPAECCWVVAQVLKILLKEISGFGLEYDIIDRQEGAQNRTLSSVLVVVNGVGMKQKLRTWEGTIQWIGKSPFRKFHKRKNWFVGVSMFEELKQSQLNENDVTYQTFRASGPGGQHRNKVETAVRAVHIPSGIIASASDSKSQLQNKESALIKLKKELDFNNVSVMRERINEHWKDHLSLERGNAIRVYKGDKFEEVSN